MDTVRGRTLECLEELHQIIPIIMTYNLYYMIVSSLLRASFHLIFDSIVSAAFDAFIKVLEGLSTSYPNLDVQNYPHRS